MDSRQGHPAGSLDKDHGQAIVTSASSGMTSLFEGSCCSTFTLNYAMRSPPLCGYDCRRLSYLLRQRQGEVPELGFTTRIPRCCKTSISISKRQPFVVQATYRMLRGTACKQWEVQALGKSSSNNNCRHNCMPKCRCRADHSLHILICCQLRPSVRTMREIAVAQEPVCCVDFRASGKAEKLSMCRHKRGRPKELGCTSLISTKTMMNNSCRCSRSSGSSKWRLGR